MKYLFLSLRPKQWIKNLFIFLPLIFGKKMLIFPTNLKFLAAFFLFSFSTGTVYLINDILDFEKDKFHPSKRFRPIASGKTAMRHVQITAFILGVLSVIFSFMLDAYFGWTIIFYLLFNYIYTKVLKNMVIIDVFCLGGFFLLRIIAGSIIAEVEMSHWIIFLTVLLALFLGFNKRRQELFAFGDKAVFHRPVLSKYDIYFLDQMIAVITSSIVVVYMLYTVDRRTLTFFGTTHLIYSIPFVYYGVFRYLYLVRKRNKGEDPTGILLSDINTQLNLLLWIIVCVAVIYFRI